MTPRDLSLIAELLMVASSKVTSAPDRQPWQYGWYLPEYRRSARAALPSAGGPVRVDDDGLHAYEEAADRLLREKRIRERWDPQEFWGILASLVVTAAARSENRGDFLESNIDLLRTIGPQLTILLVANASWDRPPMLIGSNVVGNADAEFLDFVNQSAAKRASVNEQIGHSWLEEDIKPRTEGGPPPIAFACWSPGQGGLAYRHAERQLQNLLDLTMLLESDLKAHEIYHRGPTNRPGVRGLTLDRGAIEHGLREAARHELGSSPLSIDAQGKRIHSARWFGIEPLPLGELLEQEYLYKAVRSCLKEDPISNRIRLAARWFSDAHYSLAGDDAALALGVAMDALLTGQNTMPGSAMADRFALLSQDPQDRRERVKTYLDFYAVRSSVAHGRHSRKLDESDFLDSYREAVHWTATRSIALRDQFSPSTEKEVDELFNDLRWGARSWSLPPGE